MAPVSAGAAVAAAGGLLWFELDRCDHGFELGALSCRRIGTISGEDDQSLAVQIENMDDVGLTLACPLSTAFIWPRIGAAPEELVVARADIQITRYRQLYARGRTSAEQERSKASSARRIADAVLAAAAEQANCGWIATFDEGFGSPSIPSRLL
jgi:hypothetical protein